jgi:hypothetical protein
VQLTRKWGVVFVDLIGPERSIRGDDMKRMLRLSVLAFLSTLLATACGGGGGGGDGVDRALEQRRARLTAGELIFNLVADRYERKSVVVTSNLAFGEDENSNNISVYRIDASTGALTSIGAAVATGTYPVAVTTTGTIL